MSFRSLFVPHRPLGNATRICRQNATRIFLHPLIIIVGTTVKKNCPEISLAKSFGCRVAFGSQEFYRLSCATPMKL